jgi:hypothetical protein
MISCIFSLTTGFIDEKVYGIYVVMYIYIYIYVTIDGVWIGIRIS